MIAAKLNNLSVCGVVRAIGKNFQLATMYADNDTRRVSGLGAIESRQDLLFNFEPPAETYLH